MPAPDQLLTFTIAALLLIIAPGPAVMFAVSRALAYGRRNVLITVAGLTMVGLGVGMAVSGREK